MSNNINNDEIKHNEDDEDREVVVPPVHLFL